MWVGSWPPHPSSSLPYSLFPRPHSFSQLCLQVQQHAAPPATMKPHRPHWSEHKLPKNHRRGPVNCDVLPFTMVGATHRRWGRPPTIFIDNGCQFWTPRKLLSKMTPKLSSFVVGKIGTFYRANRTLNLDLSQTEPYFEVTIPNHNRGKKCFPTVYNLTMFELVCKKLLFF